VNGAYASAGELICQFFL